MTRGGQDTLRVVYSDYLGIRAGNTCVERSRKGTFAGAHTKG